MSVSLLRLAIPGLLALLLTSCDGAGPKHGDPVGEIGYVGADGALYVIDVETEAIRKLADDLGGGIRWSPDGSRVAFVNRHAYEPSFQVYVMDADGSNRRVVTLWEEEGKLQPNPNGGVHPVWSPDGERIAFSRCMDCEIGGNNFEILIVDLDTTKGLQEDRLTDNFLEDGIQDWSSDGKKILFHSGLAPDGTWDRYSDIYDMSSNGSSKRRVLVNDSTFGRSRARYSPDSKRIAFIGGSESNEIYAANADGSDIRQITDNSLNEILFSWSPDGQWIAFWAETSREVNGTLLGHIYIVSADGSEQRKLTSGPAVYGPPEWRPRPH